MADTIRPHPEYFAAQRLLVAERQRFTIGLHTQPGWENGPDGHPFKSWLEGRPSPVFDRAIAEAFLPAVRTASSCEIRGRLNVAAPFIESADESARRGDWIARYIRKEGRALHVDTSANGVFDDIPFWHWILRIDAEVTCHVDRARFDAGGLWAHAWDPGEGNHSIGTAAAKRARDATADGRSIAVTTKVDGSGVRPCLTASQRVISELFESAIRACHWHPDFCAAVAPEVFAHDKVRGLETSISVKLSRAAEGELERLLKRGVNRPADDRALEQGLTAAELVAAACGRRAKTLGRFHEAEEQALAVVQSQGPITDATLDLAHRLASDPRIRTAQINRWLGDATKAECQALLDDLVKRLEACRTERRVRATAPNAAPLPPLADATSLWPEAHRSVPFYAADDDVPRLLDAIGEATGAIYHWLDAAGGRELRPAGSAWDLRQALRERLAGGVSFRKLPMLYISWPAAAEPSVLREVETRTVRDETTGEMVQRQVARVRAGWGVARLAIGGRRADGGDTLLWSTFEYPTGTELRGSRYQRLGPWTAVDWKSLRSAIRTTRGLMREHALGFVAASEPVLVLPDAAAAAAEGVWLGGKAGWDRHTLIHGAPPK